MEREGSEPEPALRKRDRENPFRNWQVIDEECSKKQETNEIGPKVEPQLKDSSCPLQRFYSAQAF